MTFPFGMSQEDLAAAFFGRPMPPAAPSARAFELAREWRAVSRRFAALAEAKSA